MTNDGLGLTDIALVVPRGRKGLDPMHLDLSEVVHAERRISEMQRSNPMTFPELATVYNIGICTLTKLISLVELESKDARRELDLARAVFIMDHVESILESKKIKSSMDTREAASKLDPDIQQAQQRVDILVTISEYLQNKRKDLERVYYGAKALADMHLGTPDKKNYGGHSNG